MISYLQLSFSIRAANVGFVLFVFLFFFFSPEQ